MKKKIITGLVAVVVILAVVMLAWQMALNGTEEPSPIRPPQMTAAKPFPICTSPSGHQNLPGDGPLAGFYCDFIIDTRSL